MRRHFTTALLLLAPVALWAGAAAAQDTTQAQKDKSQYQQQNRDSSNQQYNNPNDDSQSDEAVLMRIHRSNQMEIQAGRLAQKNGSSAKVKAFGQKLVRDHSAADQKVVALASRLGYTLPRGDGMDYGQGRNPQNGADSTRRNDSTYSSAQDQDSTGHGDLKRLATLKGAAFDTAFANAMVDGHGKAISMLERAQNQVQSQELRSLISSTLPTIRQHLQTAESLSGSVTTTSSKEQ